MHPPLFKNLVVGPYLFQHSSFTLGSQRWLDKWKPPYYGRLVSIGSKVVKGAYQYLGTQGGGLLIGKPNGRVWVTM